VSRRFFVWAAIVGLFLDQVAKIAVYGMFRGGEFSEVRTVPMLGDVLKLAFQQNRQGVFGLHFGPQFLYLVLPLAASALVVWYGLRAKDTWSATAFGMILAGALGNVIDRVRFGYVVDYVVFEMRRLGFQWFTFNLADALIFVGVVMLLGREFLRHRPSGNDQVPMSNSQRMTEEENTQAGAG